MQTAADIPPHIQSIREIDELSNKSRLERRQALSALVVADHRERVAGCAVPAFDTTGPYARTDGFVSALADELVNELRKTIEQQAELADCLEADGAKAAAILRGMNAVIKVCVERDICGNPGLVVIADVETKASEFAGIQRAACKAAREAGQDLARGFGQRVVAATIKDTRMARNRAHEAARRDRSLASNSEKRVLAAGRLGFQKARLAMFRSLIGIQSAGDGLRKKEFSLLMRGKSFVNSMRMEACPHAPP